MVLLASGCFFDAPFAIAIENVVVDSKKHPSFGAIYEHGNSERCGPAAAAT
jgi:hypothetical protein